MGEERYKCAFCDRKFPFEEKRNRHQGKCGMRGIDTFTDTEDD